MFRDSTFHRRPAIAALALAFATGACTTSLIDGQDGIGFRETRFQEISAMQEYRACVGDATRADQEAREKGNPGGYMTSARLLEKCEAGLGSEAGTLAQEERMRAYALSVLDYLKAGDVKSARLNFEKFRQTFAGYDLHFPDGSSFIDTMELLTGLKAPPAEYEVSLLNVNSELRSELQRIRYWKRN